MTAQIGDVYKYEGNQYTIVAESQCVLFNPRDYGLEAHMSSTACYRGYWCEYEIANEGLFLDNLFLYNRDNDYPDFLGIAVSPPEYGDLESGEEDENQRHFPKYDGHRKYSNVHLRIPYTGKILVGSGFLREFYVHLGLQMSYAYKTLLEFTFENGKLISVNDRSDSAQKFREAKYLDLLDYRGRAEYYVRQHQDNAVIAKLKGNVPMTEADVKVLEGILWSEVGTKQEYVAEYGEKPLGEFVREIVGLDMNAAKAAFAEYLNDANLDSRQIYFVNQIVEFIVHNGMMKDLSVLQEPPFTDQGSIVEVFTDLTLWAGIRRVIEQINANARAA